MCVCVLLCECIYIYKTFYIHKTQLLNKSVDVTQKCQYMAVDNINWFFR